MSVVAERTGNPFLRSSTGGRVLSAMMLPQFMLVPPAGFGVLTTTGRRSGRARRKCIRAIRRGDRVYIVSIRPSAWLKNVQADPQVTLRIRGGTFTGVARGLRDSAERASALDAYCNTLNPFDYMECMMWRRGRPNRSKIEALHRTWFARGVPLVVELNSSLA
jgi:deazaflavin-dependent oxidoreductase (nitroreductase family)